MEDKIYKGVNIFLIFSLSVLSCQQEVNLNGHYHWQEEDNSVYEVWEIVNNKFIRNKIHENLDSSQTTELVFQNNSIIVDFGHEQLQFDYKIDKNQNYELVDQYGNNSFLTKKENCLDHSEYYDHLIKGMGIDAKLTLPSLIYNNDIAFLPQHLNNQLIIVEDEINNPILIFNGKEIDYRTNVELFEEDTLNVTPNEDFYIDEILTILDSLDLIKSKLNFVSSLSSSNDEQVQVTTINPIEINYKNRNVVFTSCINCVEKKDSSDLDIYVNINTEIGIFNNQDTIGKGSILNKLNKTLTSNGGLIKNNVIHITYADRMKFIEYLNWREDIDFNLGIHYPIILIEELRHSGSTTDE